MSKASDNNSNSKGGPRTPSEINAENIDQVDFDSLVVRVVCLVSNSENFEMISSYLGRRGWEVVTVEGVKELLTEIPQFKPDFVMISMNLKHPKISSVPHVVNQTFDVSTIVFSESMNAYAMQKMNEVKNIPIMKGFVSGPMVQRKMTQIIQDMYKKDAPAFSETTKDTQDTSPGALKQKESDRFANAVKASTKDDVIRFKSEKKLDEADNEIRQQRNNRFNDNGQTNQESAHGSGKEHNVTQKEGSKGKSFYMTESGPGIGKEMSEKQKGIGRGKEHSMTQEGQGPGKMHSAEQKGIGPGQELSANQEGMGAGEMKSAKQDGIGMGDKHSATQEGMGAGEMKSAKQDGIGMGKKHSAIEKGPNNRTHSVMEKGMGAGKQHRATEDAAADEELNNLYKKKQSSGLRGHSSTGPRSPRSNYKEDGPELDQSNDGGNIRGMDGSRNKHTGGIRSMENEPKKKKDKKITYELVETPEEKVIAKSPDLVSIANLINTLVDEIHDPGQPRPKSVSETYSRVAVITVRTSKVEGLLIVGIDNEGVIPVDRLADNLKKIAVSQMKKIGDDVEMSEPSLITQNIDAQLLFQSEGVQLLSTAIAKGSNMSISFMKMKDVWAICYPTQYMNMARIKPTQLPTDQPLDFKLYVRLEKNAKFYKVNNETSSFSGGRKDRLLKKKETLFIEESSRRQYQDSINRRAMIDAMEEAENKDNESDPEESDKAS